MGNLRKFKTRSSKPTASEPNALESGDSNTENTAQTNDTQQHAEKRLNSAEVCADNGETDSLTTKEDVGTVAEDAAIASEGKLHQSKQLKKNSRKQKSKNTSVENIPRGMPKSGRFWKQPRTKLTGMIQKTKHQTSWEKKMQRKRDAQAVKDFQTTIREQIREEIKEKKSRQDQYKKRKDENRKKSEVVQVIKNTQKIKKMKKKHLRLLQKRDTVPLFHDSSRVRHD